MKKHNKMSKLHIIIPISNRNKGASEEKNVFTKTTALVDLKQPSLLALNSEKNLFENWTASIQFQFQDMDFEEPDIWPRESKT